MSLTERDMAEIVDRFYSVSAVGDFDAAEAMMTDDFFIEEADCLPMAGLYQGKTALRELYAKVMGMMDVAGLERGPVMVGPDSAVCHVAFRFADPGLADAELLELFRFRDGKVSEIRPYYFEPSTVVAACAAKAAKATG